jgi:hypothetical protein
MHLLISLTDAQVANLINLGLLIVTAIGVSIAAIGVAVSAVGVFRRPRS